MGSKAKKYIMLGTMILLLIIIPSLIYFFGWKDFQVKYFKEKLILNVNDPFKLANFEVCYGNLFHCQEAEYHLISEKIDTSKIGVYTIKYQLNYQNKQKEIEQTIEVADLENPTMEIEEKEIQVCPNGSFINPKMSATDNYDGNITEKITSNLKDQEIIFEVTDSSGNKTEKRVPAILKDTEFPKIILKGSQRISLPLNRTYQEDGYTATDNCDGDLTKNVTVENNVNFSKEGEYKIKYSVKDSSENQTTVERIIVIYNSNNSSVPTGKNIYLTFDDGPSYYTSKLLDVLKKYHVPATFFVTNQGLTNGYDQQILRAYQEGHTIGLHTYTHNYKDVYSSEEAYFNDLYAIQKKVKDITGHDSYIIRFPGGSSNTISKFNPGIMSRLTKLVEEKGFHYFDWNLDSDDAGRARNSSTVASNVIKGLGRGSNYIVLQHDVKGYSVDAVETIIQYGLSHGYTFKALNENSPTAHHRINN